MNVSLLVLLVVFFLIVVRRLGGIRVQIWQAMAGGALAVLVAGAIAPAQALAAIDLDVMLFLFGMFIIGQALTESGYLYALAYRIFGRLRSTDTLVIGLLAVVGLASALLMNDTLAVVCTPLVLRLAREHGMDPKLLLLTLAFAVTTGSVLSPIGNPQNLLIALHGGVPDPFLTFLRHLAAPTVLSLALCYLVLRLYYRRGFHATPLVHAPVAVRDESLARLARLALFIVIVLVGCKIFFAALGTAADVRLSYIALAAAAPIVVFSPRRLALLRHIDWPTLIFFAAMFVLMASVWRSGVFQGLIERQNSGIAETPVVLALSVGISQLISNVPLVALYLPLLGTDSEAVLMALAAGSTIAGNLLILGAASNVIIIQSAERHGATLGYYEFARVGIPLTALQLIVYWFFLEW